MVAGRYQLEEQLGEGGMGVVWRALDLELGRPVSLKQSLGGDTGQIRREARIGAGLLHPNVVTVFDTVVDDRDTRWLVTEYLAARSLEQIIEDEGPLPRERIRRIGAQLAAALAAMHARGIVHRDLKPGNVLVTADDMAKLTDLGIARWTEVTRTGGAQFAGTLGYVAPEVAAGGEAGAAADVFSLGATLYAAVEGRSPWGSGEDGPFVQMRRAVGGRPEPMRLAGELAPVLRALMEHHPGDRPTAAEAGDLLGGDLSTPVGRFRRRLSRRGRRGLVLAGAPIAVTALVAAFVITQPSPPATTAHGPGTLGDDPAAADPCAAISTDSLSPFGRPFIDPEVLNFGSCVVTTELADGSGQVQTTLALTGPLRYPSRVPVSGKMGEVERSQSGDDACERSISLADLNRVVITTRPLNGLRGAPLCAVSGSVLSDVQSMLANGPLPKRTRPFAPWSLARVDACGLLDMAEVDEVLGRVRRADTEFGGWGCTWQKDRRTVVVRFSREWPIELDEEVPGERVLVGDRNAVVGVVPGVPPKCGVQVVHKFYTPEQPVLRGTEPHREEIAVVTVEDTSAVDAAGLCGPARSLAEALVRRLP
ncbi:hypothetical protein GCM10027184_17470 [Saccharothrix stipae]